MTLLLEAFNKKIIRSVVTYFIIGCCSGNSLMPDSALGTERTRNSIWAQREQWESHAARMKEYGWALLQSWRFHLTIRAAYSICTVPWAILPISSFHRERWRLTPESACVPATRPRPPTPPTRPIQRHVNAGPVVPLPPARPSHPIARSLELLPWASRATVRWRQCYRLSVPTESQTDVV